MRSSCRYLRTTLLFAISILIIPLAYGQAVSVSGTVKDPDGNPLSGVSVSLKNTTTGTTTGNDGTFRLNLAKSPGATLVFSGIGYTTKEVALGESNVIDVELENSFESLNEAVVVGYGTQKRKDITGSVASVDKKRLEDLPNTNFAQALQGSVAGLSLDMNSSSAEGNDFSIIIRGRKSISAKASPLIVLDGIPYNGSISDINTTDIASVDILKDASSAAIYGSRGSNGVILITTKKGSTGKPTISYDGFYGIQEIANLPPVLSPEQFYQFKETREPGVITVSEQENYDNKKFPDWLDLATRKGMRTQHSLGVRGGTKDIKYYISGTYLGVKGVAENDKFQRLSTRINVEAKLSDWLTLGTNSQLSYNNRSGLEAYFNGDYGAYQFNPLTTAFGEDGKQLVYPWPEDIFFANPLSPLLAKNDDHTYKVFSNNYIVVKFPFIKGLSYRLNTGVEYTNRDQSTYWGRDTKRGLAAGGDMSVSNNISRNYTVENILAYDRRFGKHAVNITGLYSYENDDIKINSLNASGFPNDVLTYYQANVAQSIEPAASFSKETLISQMGRINYGFNDKYLVTLTGRRDGFSGFGANKKFSFFPSAALAWNLINEPFLSHTGPLTNLKLRLSYGSNGNQAVGAYETLAKLSEQSYVDGITTLPGYVPTSLGTPDLGWETTNTANVGLDFGFWNGRLQGSFDVFQSKTHDLLLRRKISSVQGVTDITENIGRTSNKGIDIALNSVNIQSKDLEWSTNANFSIVRNRIDDLYGDGKDDTLNKWFLGQPINVNFGYVYDGVWQEKDDLSQSPQPNTKPGYAKVRDLNGDGMINDKDRTIIGSRQPKFVWGLSNTLKYKNFSLYVFIHGVQGTSRPNSLLSDNGVNSGVRHNTVIKNWWTPENPTNDFYMNDVKANQYGVSLYESDAFVRVKDISLSYSFSPSVLSRMNISRLMVYFDTRNLFTFTKWSGLDPELSNQTDIPLQKEYILGLNVSL